MTAEFLYPIVWDAIRRLEALGLKVLVLTCDGAGPNHNFFRLLKAREDAQHKTRKGKRKIRKAQQETRGVEVQGEAQQENWGENERKDKEKVQEIPTVSYKTPNPYSEEERWIYFVSDVPHLIKTTRNCWANKNRHLWVSLWLHFSS